MIANLVQTKVLLCSTEALPCDKGMSVFVLYVRLCRGFYVLRTRTTIKCNNHNVLQPTITPELSWAAWPLRTCFPSLSERKYECPARDSNREPVGDGGNSGGGNGGQENEKGSRRFIGHVAV